MPASSYYSARSVGAPSTFYEPPPEDSEASESDFPEDHASDFGGESDYRSAVGSRYERGSMFSTPLEPPTYSASVIAPRSEYDYGGASGYGGVLPSMYSMAPSVPLTYLEEEDEDEEERAIVERARPIPKPSRERATPIAALRQNFILVDATREEFPISYVSAGFVTMCGYSPGDIIGKPCTFLQGPGTGDRESSAVKAALEGGKQCSVVLLCFRKDGVPFWCMLSLHPIVVDDQVLRYLGVAANLTHKGAGNNVRFFTDSKAVPLAVSFDTKYELRESAFISPAQIQAEFKMASEGRMSALTDKEREEARAMQREVNALQRPPKPEVAPRVRHLLEDFQQCFMLTDPWLPDNPIVHASEPFLALTGYDVGEVVGTNWGELLRGEATDPAVAHHLHTSISKFDECVVRMLLYRKDGGPFWAMLTYVPLFAHDRKARFFVGLLSDVGRELGPGASYGDLDLDAMSMVSGITSNAGTEAPPGQQQQQQQGGGGSGGSAYGGGSSYSASSTAQPPRPIVGQRNSAKLSGVGEVGEEGGEEGDLVFSLVAGQKLQPGPHKRGTREWRSIQRVIDRDGELQFAHFRRKAKLGHGGQAIVHLVELENTGVRFAMKTYDKRDAVEDDFVDRILCEEKVLVACDHPFVVSLFAVFSTETQVHFLLEHCEGGSMLQLLDRFQFYRMKEEHVRFYAAEVLLGIQYLHLQGFIWRDVKPENVMLNRDGHVQLLDFNISYVGPPTRQSVARVRAKIPGGDLMAALQFWRKEEARPSTPLGHTLVVQPEVLTNSFVGTEQYMCPEIVNATGHTSTADWWGYGILVFDMIYGFTPFRGAKREQTFENILRRPLVFPKEPPVSDECKDLISQLLQRDQWRRLGHRQGAEDLKRHPWFVGIDWAMMRDKRPPHDPVKLMKKDKEKDEEGAARNAGLHAVGADTGEDGEAGTAAAAAGAAAAGAGAAGAGAAAAGAAAGGGEGAPAAGGGRGWARLREGGAGGVISKGAEEGEGGEGGGADNDPGEEPGPGANGWAKLRAKRTGEGVDGFGGEGHSSSESEESERRGGGRGRDDHSESEESERRGGGRGRDDHSESEESERRGGRDYHSDSEGSGDGGGREHFSESESESSYRGSKYDVAS